MEIFLAWGLKRWGAYEMRYSIFNGDEGPNPRSHVRVTLFHLYRDSGRTLQDWSLWRTWVESLHPGLLKLCEIDRADLAADASLMETFHQRLCSAEKERRPAFVTFGQKDLLEPKRKVLARQERATRRFNRAPSRAVMLAEKRARYFPWLERVRHE
jgi:hypothetical protein